MLSEEQKAHDKIFVGEVPIMLRSSYCSLFEKTDKDLTGLGECPYDQARAPGTHCCPKTGSSPRPVVEGPPICAAWALPASAFLQWAWCFPTGH